MGQKLRDQLLKVQQQFPNIIKEVRGKGLFNVIELNNKALFPLSAYDICLKLKERGILAKPTHDTIIRLTPPLCMSLNRPTFSFLASCLFTPTLNPILVKTKDEKKAKKAEVTSKKSQSKGNIPKGAAPKGPKLGGGGGKR